MVDPRAPVLVGAAAISQRPADAASAWEATALVTAAAEATRLDLSPVEVVITSRGTAKYNNAAGLVAHALGLRDVRTITADLGVLQTTPFAWSARAIAAGDVDCVLIAGGEARYSERHFAVIPTDDAGAEPDEWWRPEEMIISRQEIDARLVMAASQYAMIENRRRFNDGQSIAEHAAVVAGLMERFNAVARDNPDAWHRTPMTATEIATSSERNPPQSFPYHKWHVSQMNIDQAAAFVMCAFEAAVSMGVARDAMVFPHAIVESNAMVPVSERVDVTRSPGFALAGRRAFDAAGCAPDSIEHVDLYSCFPIAVRVQAQELGISLDRQLTVTGGMTFAGGPLNNYMFQSLAKMVYVLRDDPGSHGLVTAISGMITKQGVSIWSTEPPARPCVVDDVSDAARHATTRQAVLQNEAGPATVVTYTVMYERGSPWRGVVVADRATGERTIAINEDSAVMASMTTEEWCGRAVQIEADQTFSV